MKRLFSAIMIIAIISLMAGCSSGDSSVETTQAVAQESVQETSPAAAEQGETSGEEQTITIWRPQNTEEIEAWWTQMLDSFNEQYKGQYKAVQETFPKSGSDSYSEKVNTAVIAGNLPDLLLVDGPDVAGYAQNGILVPLDAFVSEEDKADMLDSCVKQGSYNGSLYSVALWESSVGIYYNEDILTEAGIEVPKTQEEAWTWDELYDVASQLNKEGQFGITLNTNQSQITYYYSPLIEQLGSCLINPEGSQTDGYINSPESVEVANFIKKFYDNGIANIEPTSTEFADGGSALWLATSYQISMLTAQYPDLKWGVTYYPVSNDGKAATPTGSWTVGMSSNAKDQAAAYVLLDFMTNTEANLTGSPASGYLPARYSSTEQLTQYREEPYRVFMEQLETNGAPRPRTAVWTTLNASYNSAISDIVLGSDPQEKLDEIANIIDEEYNMNYAK